MKNKVVTFGEIMLRLSTEAFGRFLQAGRFEVTYGGGEANVAVSLANYGLESYFVTKLPIHELGQSALNHLRQFGVHTEYILRGGDRLGIYFLEPGVSQRPSKVIYDRANSAISLMMPSEINWEEIFDDKDWFHFTGITPALGENASESLLSAVKTAKKKGLVVSCDLNFRKKMWTEHKAQSTMIPLMEYVDVCIANEEDAEKSLGMKPEKSSIEDARLDELGYFELMSEMKRRFSFSTVAITLRESYSASRNGWSAVMLDEKDCLKAQRSKRYEIQIVDRVGGGDSFAGGLIYGLMKMENTKDALEFAVAASCLKQTIPGDFNHFSIDEVEKLAKGYSSGRVER
ncbi:MAG: sugar kinase [Bacteroidota bacterium]|nr:sugar kinase [Bacteroidota bacterium]MDP4190544.1 sugar kinase [Bacteroidota bacterium]MDP4193653.1 sugar kinase [Bacteroidota bacterium]